MKNKPYFQCYESKGMVYYTDQNDKPIIAPFSINKLYDFIVANYEECNVAMYLDNNWDDVCLDYWNSLMNGQSEFKSNNLPQQTAKV